MEDWVPTLSAGPLLGIAAAAIALILVLVIVFKLHAFLTLIIVSAATGLAAGIPLEGIVPTMTKGFGSTLASVALLVGLGAMLGRLVETSGGAKSLAETLVARFGEQRAPLRPRRSLPADGFPHLLRRRPDRHAARHLRRGTPTQRPRPGLRHPRRRRVLRHAHLPATAPRANLSCRILQRRHRPRHAPRPNHRDPYLADLRPLAR